MKPDDAARREMLKRLGLFGAASLLWPSQAFSQGLRSPRQRVEIDEWTFELPADWHLDEKQSGEQKYFEAADRRRACYVAAITAGAPGNRPSAEFARALQESYLATLNKMSGSRWRTLRQDVTQCGELAVSTYDHFDERKKYRILGKVLALSPKAIFIKFHDYDCESYQRSVSYFSPLADSLRGRARRC